MLYIVSTPIGNLKDITLRALEVLKEVDLIACEDTRHTRILLNHYGIDKPTVSFHSYSQRKRIDELILKLKEGSNIALVSDAGTPGISDPGYLLIKEAIAEGIAFTAIPGPSAFLAALTLSGIDSSRFVFRGFLSPKPGRRKNQLAELKMFADYPVVLYESAHRIIKLLEDIAEVFGRRRVICVREATKKFEEVLRGCAGDLAERFREMPSRGEFVVIISRDNPVS